MSESKNLDAELVSLYHRDRPLLPEYAWEEEESRWRELVKCLLIVGAEMEPESVVKGIQMLDSKDLLSMKNLVRITKKQRQSMTAALVKIGVERTVARKAVSILIDIAQSIDKNWGHVEGFLRSHGLKIVNDLAANLQNEDLTQYKATKIATVWLQEVANFPLLLENDPHVVNFCKEHNISFEQLLEVADRNGLDVVILDDVLALGGKSKRSHIRKKRKDANK